MVAAALAIGAVLAPRVALADPCNPVAPVFSGDPCDPVSGPLPMMPGLPLVLPSDGPQGHWTAGPPAVTSLLTGDVDLAVRVGTFATDTEVPPPAGDANSVMVLENIAGGGASGQGLPVPFTVFVTDGPGALTYGAPLGGLDQRPVVVFGYADLDGDGTIGPTDTDGKGDNELEKQEAVGHVGRQMGQIDVDRFSNSLAVRVGAPASIGGLRIGLVSGMYTGSDPGRLWSDGTPIFTNWPFFPPLDPVAVVFLDEPNPPDSNGPNILFYQPSQFFLPKPDTADLVESFALATDGSNASTDQFVSVSGAAVGVRLFRDVTPANFTASSRLVVRPAPTIIGNGRVMVSPVGEVGVKIGREVKIRVLAVDALGNIADPPISGISARLEAEGGLKILSPNSDGDPYGETLDVTSARGVTVRLGTRDVAGRVRLTLFDPPPAVPRGLDQALVFASQSGRIDADDDGIADDGDGSGTIGDRPCSVADITGGIPCDDNCPNVVNPSQSDSDGDGQGNCCDGACVIDDGNEGCLECPESASRYRSVTTRARTAIHPRAGITRDRVRLRTLLRLDEGQSLSPARESVEVAIAQGEKLHYFVQLPSVFSQTNDAPTYVYEDPAGTLGGIIYAQLRTNRRGVRAIFRARGLSLVSTLPAEDLTKGLVVAVTIGDDTFTRHLKCTSSLQSARCASTD